MVLKEELREKFLNKRKYIENKAEKSLMIAEKVKADERFLNAKTVAVYKSLPSEVSTEEIINYALSFGKTVATPKVCGKDLQFYTISPQTKFTKSGFGVLEPAGDESDLIPKTDIELAIVPGVCFDKERNRTGFGKGFYDRFLKDTDIYKLAIAFEEQISDETLPTDENDIKMDCIITDKAEY